MYALLLTCMLTQAPQPSRAAPGTAGVILVERASGLSPERTLSLVEEVSAALEREGLPMAVAPGEVEARLRAVGAPQPSSCEGERSCLLGLARRLDASLIILLEAETLADTLGLHLTALSTREDAPPREVTLTVAKRPKEELGPPLVPFVRSVRSALQPPAPPVATDAPRVEASEPPPAPLKSRLTLQAPAVPLGVTPSSAPPPRSRALLYVTGGSALVTTGAAIAFGLVGLEQKQRLEQARYLEPTTGHAAYRLPRGEAERLSRRSNRAFTLALSSTALSALLGSTATWLWLREPPAR